MSDIQQIAAPSGKWKTFKARFLSTVILLSLLGGAVLWSNVWGYRALVCIFCMLTAWEWGSMLRRSGKASQPRLTKISGMVYPLVLAGLMSDWHMAVAWAFFSPVLVTILSFTWEMRRNILGSRSLRAVATTLLSFVYPGWMFAFIMFAFLDHPMVPGGYLISFAIWVIVVTKSSDMFAYVSGVLAGGKIWKGNKLIPHISPKKTWEGFAGSLVLTTVFGVWLAHALDLACFVSGGGDGQIISAVDISAGWFIAVVVVLFFLAVVGDLAGSLIKRSLSLKDSSSILPGIGGFFDLIDSPAFTVPVALFLFLCMTL